MALKNVSNRFSERRSKLELCLDGVEEFLSELLLKPIQRRWSYVFDYKRYLEQLEDENLLLCHKRAEMRRKVDAAKSENNIISPQVDNCLAQVDAINDAVKNFIRESKNRKKLYFSPTTRYSLSKKAVQKIERI